MADSISPDRARRFADHCGDQAGGANSNPAKSKAGATVHPSNVSAMPPRLPRAKLGSRHHQYLDSWVGIPHAFSVIDFPTAPTLRQTVQGKRAVASQIRVSG